jgi:hypothetical protein
MFADNIPGLLKLHVVSPITRVFTNKSVENPNSGAPESVYAQKSELGRIGIWRGRTPFVPRFTLTSPPTQVLVHLFNELKISKILETQHDKHPPTQEALSH